MSLNDKLELSQVDDGREVQLSFFGRFGGEYGITAELINFRINEIAPDAELITGVINSEGGEVKEGHAIYTLLKNHSARVELEVVAMAYSVASVVLQAADVRRMASNSILLLHWTQATLEGSLKEINKTLELGLIQEADRQLVEIYSSRSGLSVEQVEELLDANEGIGSFIGPEQALELGLIDEIMPAKQAAAGSSRELSQLLSELPTALQTLAAKWKPSTEGDEMTTSDKSPSLQDQLSAIKSACPGATSEFVLQQLEAGNSPAAAASSWAQHLVQENEKLKEKAALGDKADERIKELEQKHKDELEQASKKGLGNPGMHKGSEGENDTDEKDPVGKFDALVSELVQKGHDRRKACAMVAKKYPELHQQFLGASQSNQTYVQQRLLKEKYDPAKMLG